MKIRVEEVYEWERLSGEELPRLRQLTAANNDGVNLGKVKLADRPICESELVSQYPDTPMVYQLYVSENARRQGVGSALMDVVERLVAEEGKGKLLLCVKPDNKPARRMYEARGYEYLGPETVESIWHLHTGIVHVQLLPMIKKLR